jgi:hypothetical protein
MPLILMTMRPLQRTRSLSRHEPFVLTGYLHIEELFRLWNEQILDDTHTIHPQIFHDQRAHRPVYF